MFKHFQCWMLDQVAQSSLPKDGGEKYLGIPNDRLPGKLYDETTFKLVQTPIRPYR